MRATTLGDHLVDVVLERLIVVDIVGLRNVLDNGPLGAVVACHGNGFEHLFRGELRLLADIELALLWWAGLRSVCVAALFTAALLFVAQELSDVARDLAILVRVGCTDIIRVGHLPRGQQGPLCQVDSEREAPDIRSTRPVKLVRVQQPEDEVAVIK